MFTFLTFVAGIVTGVVGLIAVVAFFGSRNDSVDKYNVIKVQMHEFTNDVGDHYNDEAADKTRAHEMSDDDIEQALENIWLISLHGSPDAQSPESLRIRVHEAGHAMILLVENRSRLIFVVGAPHNDEGHGAQRGGVVRHEYSGDPDLSRRVAYGGIVAEEMVLGKGSIWGATADLAKVLASAHFAALPWDQEHKYSADDFEAWGALGLCDPSQRNAESIERTIAECQRTRARVRETLESERPALMALVEALERQPKLARKDVFAVWDQHKSPAAREREAEKERGYNRPLATNLRPAKRRPTPEAPPTK